MSWQGNRKSEKRGGLEETRELEKGHSEEKKNITTTLLNFAGINREGLVRTSKGHNKTCCQGFSKKKGIDNQDEFSGGSKRTPSEYGRKRAKEGAKEKRGQRKSISPEEYKKHLACRCSFRENRTSKEKEHGLQKNATNLRNYKDLPLARLKARGNFAY